MSICSCDIVNVYVTMVPPYRVRTGGGLCACSFCKSIISFTRALSCKGKWIVGREK